MRAFAHFPHRLAVLFAIVYACLQCRGVCQAKRKDFGKVDEIPLDGISGHRNGSAKQKDDPVHDDGRDKVAE